MEIVLSIEQRVGISGLIAFDYREDGMEGATEVYNKHESLRPVHVQKLTAH